MGTNENERDNDAVDRGVNQHDQREEQSDPVDRGISSVSKRPKTLPPKGVLLLILLTGLAILAVNYNSIFGSDNEDAANQVDEPPAVGVPENDANSPAVADIDIPPEQTRTPEPKPKPPKVVQSGGPTPPPTASQQSGPDKLTPEERRMQSGLFAYNGGGSTSNNDDSGNSTRSQQSAGQPAFDQAHTRLENASMGGDTNASINAASLGGTQGQGRSSSGGGSGGNLKQQLSPQRLTGVSAQKLAHPSFMLTQGHMLDCALKTAISSVVAGKISCRLTQDVYSTNGKVVLLDRGTLLTGQYEGGMTKGQTRLFVVWTRAETPEGVMINLDSPGTDSLGRGGVSGRVDRHFWQRFGGALLVSVVGDVGDWASNQGQSGDRIEFGNTTNSAEQSVQTVLEHQIDIPPSLSKNQGDDIAIYVARDLDFSTVYSLEVDR